MVAKQKRHIKPYSREVRQLFGLPTYKDKPFSGKKDNAHVSVYDTLKEIEFIAQNRSYQTEKLANYLRANNLENTLSNIFDFLYTHVQYVQDSDTAEQVRTPLRLLADQQGDCDCYTAFIACVLTNLGVPFYLKMTDYGMTDDFGQAVGYQHVYIAVPQQGRKDYIVDVVLDNFNQEAAGIYKAYYYPMNGAAPRETEQPKASSINGLNGNRGLGAEPVSTIIVSLVGLGISLIGSYNKGVENDRAINASADRKIIAEQDAVREELYAKLAEGEGNLIKVQIDTIRAGVGLKGLALTLPSNINNYYEESNSFTEFHEQANLALTTVHQKYGEWDWDIANRWANVVTRDIIWSYKVRVEFRKEVCKALLEQGLISEYEMMQLVNYGWNQAPIYPNGVDNMSKRHGTQAFTSNTNSDRFVRKPTYSEAQLKAASRVVKNSIPAPAESKGSNVKSESTNINNSTSPKSEDNFFSKHWKTPTGKAAIIGGGVVGTLVLIGLVKAII